MFIIITIPQVFYTIWEEVILKFFPKNVLPEYREEIPDKEDIEGWKAYVLCDDWPIPQNRRIYRYFENFRQDQLEQKESYIHCIIKEALTDETQTKLFASHLKDNFDTWDEDFKDWDQLSYYEKEELLFYKKLQGLY